MELMADDPSGHHLNKSAGRETAAAVSLSLSLLQYDNENYLQNSDKEYSSKVGGDCEQHLELSPQHHQIVKTASVQSLF